MKLGDLFRTKESKVTTAVVALMLLGANWQEGETKVSLMSEVQTANAEKIEAQGYRRADILASQAFDDRIDPDMLAAIREKESGKNGIFLSEKGGGDPLKRKVPGFIVASLDKQQAGKQLSTYEQGALCWGRDGLPAGLFEEGEFWAYSEYQVDIGWHCNWYRENPNVIKDLTSEDLEARQEAMEKFAMRAMSVLIECDDAIRESNAFKAEEMDNALFNCYNQGPNALLEKRRDGKPLGSGTTKDSELNYYHVGASKIYARLKQ